MIFRSVRLREAVEIQRKRVLFVSICMISVFIFGSYIYGYEPALVMKIDQNGESLEPINITKYSKGDIIQLKISVPQNENFYFVADMNREDRKVKSIPIYTDGQFERNFLKSGAAETGNQIVPFEFQFKEAGSKYTLTITRYNKKPDGDEKVQCLVIFKKVFHTYHRYIFGIKAGIFFPFSEYKTDVYSLKYQNTAAAEEQLPSIVHSQNKDAKLILFLSIYPPGFEPGRRITPDNFFRRFHLNIGTEVSKSVLKKMYLGVGYELKTVSINIFYSRGKEDVLADGYAPGTVIVNPKITSVPVSSKSISRWGIAVSLPIDIATNLLGKIIGI